MSLRLLFVSLATAYAFRVYGEVGNLADTFGDAFALVIPTLQLAPLGKGEGDNAVNALEEMRGKEFGGHKSSQVNADFGAVVEF